MAYWLNVHTADFSKYNLGPAFIILALVSFNFNVNKDITCVQNRIDSVSLMVLNHFVSLRSSLEARERPSNTQDLQKCVICGKTQHNGIREKFRICEAPRANKFLQAAIYLQDEVFTKNADLEEGSSVFGADLCYHKTCIKGSSSYLLILINCRNIIFKVCYELGGVLK